MRRTVHAQTPAGRRGGFTLVELAVVVVIIGILAPLVYNAVTSYVAREKQELAQASMERARDLIVGHMLANEGVLPTPDTGNLIPVDMAVNEDAWQSRLGYWRAPELETGTVTGADATTMELRIYQDVGGGGNFPASDATLHRTIPNVAYVLVSSGPNLSRETVVDTSTGVVVSILKGGGPLKDSGHTEFDDIVEYATLRQLQGRYLSAR